MSNGVTWGELKAWLVEQGIKDDDMIGYWDMWWPTSLPHLKFWRGEGSDGTGIPDVNVEDI